MSLRIDPELYERLRLAAFERRVAQAAIIREAIEARLDELDAASAPDAA